MQRRLLDVLGSCVLLVLTAPVLLFAAIAVMLDGGPCFYRQTRAGLRGHRFELLKFRSMRVHETAATSFVEVTAQHPLVTPAGRWLRRFKIDELPQLVNIVRGEMSLVGPRPTLPEQVAEYTSHQHRRLEVRPGLTGWAQVNGGITIPWSDRIMLDVWYVDHCSIWLDVKILARTIAVVVFGEESNHSAVREARIYANRPGWGS